MIIELLLLGDEAIVQAEHVLSCHDERCDDIAHLYDRLTARYAGLAEVFVFVAGTARGHQYRLNHARERAQAEALPTPQQYGDPPSRGMRRNGGWRMLPGDS